MLLVKTFYIKLKLTFCRDIVHVITFPFANPSLTLAIIGKSKENLNYYFGEEI